MFIIIGIIWGLYIKNIALFILLLILLIYLANILNIKKVYILFFLLFFLYSYSFQDKVLNLYNDLEYGNFFVKIISNKEDTEYNNKYICLVKEIDGNKKYKNTKLILYTNKNTNYKYGDIIKVNGDFKYASCERNYRGFNYRRILWLIIKLLGQENLPYIKY